MLVSTFHEQEHHIGYPTHKPIGSIGSSQNTALKIGIENRETSRSFRPRPGRQLETHEQIRSVCSSESSLLAVSVESGETSCRL